MTAKMPSEEGKQNDASSEQNENDGGETSDLLGEDEDDEKQEEELSENAEALKEELAKIVVHPPTQEQLPKEIFDPAEFPDSYKENLPKENLVLQYSENFRRQYVHLYRDRKPLFLNPVNECGVEPRRLLSPTTILKRQKGNCFEYSTLLCSLLAGAGYDAYVVSGYATREVCLADESREICPLLKTKEEKMEEERKKEMKKYTVKPPKDLRSKFILKQEARAKSEKESEIAKRRQEEEEKQAELEKPPPDPLHGLRIHSWVLVLPGKREVPEGFFIEPFTGLSHPLDYESYLGIESIWSHANYWVNMQDCSEGVKGMNYDLGDCTQWEFMFNTDKPLLQIPEAEDDIIEGLEDEDGSNKGLRLMTEDTIFSEMDIQEELEKQMDMPPTWVEPIRLSRKDFEMRCPQGKKVKLYKRAKLEKFAHYLMRDGLICKLSVYEDRELTALIMVREYYAHREDKLQTKVYNHRTGIVVEYFNEGRMRCLKEHQFKASNPGPENERTMHFFDEARVDGLVSRIETPTEMTEHYKDREDFLYYKHVEFGKRPKKFGPQEGFGSNNPRPILKMVQKFHRNRSKLANEDIAELVFMCSEDKIQITYHTEDKRIASSTREYIKPHNWDEKGATLTFSGDMHQTFQVDPTSQQNKQVELYQMLLELLKAEDKCREQVRESEMEVVEILKDRTREESASELDISVYDTERNEKAKKHRRELERRQLEEKMRKQEMEVDYLAPFLAQLGEPEKLTRQQAYQLREDCLGDLKQRLIDKANLIQARFEKETQELQKKQAWYQQNQVSMQKNDEEEYLNYCSEAMFRIHILELRLNRHKENAPHKYMMLEQTLRQDPRLAEFF
ncbi:hypothetical protein CHS0354_038091 [Potamilus streckersoni]|uniref:Dynein regulatory complex subunit 7 n=1 Tax=Potamilus streckersoni TaxID=2493646 RepID=A0AAE0W103_9BIVA|nr:hypothetical protein CHS0354_038091 [Potamilus streckersoni]